MRQSWQTATLQLTLITTLSQLPREMRFNSGEMKSIQTQEVSFSSVMVSFQRLLQDFRASLAAAFLIVASVSMCGAKFSVFHSHFVCKVEVPRLKGISRIFAALTIQKKKKKERKIEF